MIVAIIIAMVGLVIATTVLALGVRSDTSTTRERKWQLALQVAEAGVEQAAAELNADPDLVYGGTVSPVPIAGGDVATRVTPLANGAGFQIDAVGYVPSATASQVVTRRIRVLYQPAAAFRYALFSASGLFVKSAGGIDGDVYANDAVEVYNGTQVFGNVTSGTSTVKLNQNAEVIEDADGNGGSVFSGGYDDDSPDDWAVFLDNNAYIENDVHTRVPDSDECTTAAKAASYNVKGGMGADVDGTVYTVRGSLGVIGFTAGDAQSTCAVTTGVEPLPAFFYNESNYPTLDTMSVTEFGTLTTLSGEIKVDAFESDSIDFACKTITGSFTLITVAKITKTNTCGAVPFYSGTDPANEVIQIISLNTFGSSSDPAINVENSLQLPDPAPALLIYSKGYCDLKNSVLTTGAVYCAGIGIKNTLDITYDSRIERLVGFGPVLHERTLFRELSPSTPL